MAVQIQLRRGTAAEWTAANTVLAQGEIGIETDTSKIKIGTGLTGWNDLSYALGGGGGSAVVPLATSSITGVASFNSDHFAVSSVGQVSITGPYFVFDTDLTAAFGSGKSFGKYQNGDSIPAKGKTPAEVIKDALVANLAPTVNLSSSTTIAFNQTAISNLLNLSYTINTLGATGSTAYLEWKRSNQTDASYSQIYFSTLTPTSYTHTLTDTAFNTNGFNYRYRVTDTAGATGSASLTITPAAYSAPTAAFAITGPSANVSPETLAGTQRIRGNVKSDITATITKNSPNVPIVWWGWYFEENGSGVFTQLGATSAVGGDPSSFSTGSTTHSVATGSTAAGYRVQVADTYQIISRDSSKLTFSHVVYWGKSASSSPTSINDLTTGKDRRFVSSATTLGTYTYTYTTSASAEFCYVIIPTSPGSPGTYTTFKDINNLTVSPETGTFTENNEYGVSIGWRWYKVGNATTSTYQITAS